MEVVDERHRAARDQRETEHDVETEHVKERQHRERDVFFGDAQPGMRLHLLEVREQRTVRQHRGFGRARGAHGEEQHREVALGPLDRREPFGRQLRLVVGIEDEQRHRGRALHAGAAREIGVGRRRDQQRGLHHGELARELERGRGAVDRHGDAARDEHRQVGDHERGVVPREDHDPGAGIVLGRQAGGQAAGPGGQLAVGERPGPHDGGPVGRRGGIAQESGPEVHWPGG